MIHNHIPTLEAPNENSPSWYATYHSAFYMSQLVNNLLLSYMKTFIEVNQLEGIVELKKMS